EGRVDKYAQHILLARSKAGFQIRNRGVCVAQKCCGGSELVSRLALLRILFLLRLQHGGEHSPFAALAKAGFGSREYFEPGLVTRDTGRDTVLVEEPLWLVLVQIERGQIFGRRTQLGIRIGKLAQRRLRFSDLAGMELDERLVGLD